MKYHEWDMNVGESFPRDERVAVATFCQHNDDVPHSRSSKLHQFQRGYIVRQGANYYGQTGDEGWKGKWLDHFLRSDDKEFHKFGRFDDFSTSRICILSEDCV